MAVVLTAFSFGRGRRALYPWAQWLDGQIWKLRAGVDFKCSMHSMRRQVLLNAKRRGVMAVTSAEGDELVIQVVA